MCFLSVAHFRSKRCQSHLGADRVLVVARTSLQPLTVHCEKRLVSCWSASSPPQASPPGWPWPAELCADYPVSVPSVRLSRADPKAPFWWLVIGDEVVHIAENVPRARHVAVAQHR